MIRWLLSWQMSLLWSGWVCIQVWASRGQCWKWREVLLCQQFVSDMFDITGNPFIVSVTGEWIACIFAMFWFTETQTEQHLQNGFSDSRLWCMFIVEKWWDYVNLINARFMDLMFLACAVFLLFNITFSFKTVRPGYI